MGDSLCTYIEINTDEMNQLKPLELPEDPDEVDEQEEEQDAEIKSNAEEQKDPSMKDDEAAAAKSDAADPEPVIEEV